VKIPASGKEGAAPRASLTVGKERLYAEAVDSHIGGWYSSAVAAHRVSGP